jgi:hypothetical protein
VSEKTQTSHKNELPPPHTGKTTAFLRHFARIVGNVPHHWQASVQHARIERA